MAPRTQGEKNLKNNVIEPASSNIVSLRNSVRLASFRLKLLSENCQMENNNEFFLEAYRTRVQMLITQGDRLWTRFNYFLAIELALTGLYFVYKVNPTPIIGIVFSFIWYIISAQDFYFLREHRERVNQFEKDIILPMVQKKFVPLTEKIEGIKRSPLSFRTKYFTVTHSAVYFPILFMIFWLFFFIQGQL